MWSQHDREYRRSPKPHYFLPNGEMQSIQSIWFDDLLAQLCAWKAQHEDIFLLLDAKENIYTGCLSTALHSLGMEELFCQANGQEAPASHIRGSTAICGAFATSGVECSHVQHSAHYAGVGDHRFHLLQFSAPSIIGTSYPLPGCSTSRKLNS